MITTAKAEDVLEGKTYITGEGKLETGNMVNHGLLEWSESNKKYTVPSGYYTGGTIDSTKSYTDGYNDGYNACTKAIETNTYNINKRDTGTVSQVTYTANISGKSSASISLTITSFCPSPDQSTRLNWSTNSSNGIVYGNYTQGYDYAHGKTDFVSQIIDVTGATYFTVSIPVISNGGSTFDLVGTIKFI